MSFVQALLLSVEIIAPVVAVYTFWRYYLSIQTLGPKQIGAILHWGKLMDFVENGKVFVPWFPLKFGQHYMYELLFIPISWFILSYEGKEEHEIYSKDGVLMRVQVSLRIRLPYKDKKYLAMVVESGVPISGSEAEMADHFEDETIAVTKDVLAEFGWEDATSKAKLVEINNLAKVRFTDKDSFFCQSGICGCDAGDLTPGSGEVVLRIEQVKLTTSMQQKRERVETAKLDIRIAESESEAAAQNAGVVPKAYAAWLKTSEGQAASDDMKAEAFEAIRQGKLSADGHYNENDAVVVVRGPRNTPLNPDLQGLAVFAGLGGGKGGAILGVGGGKKVGGKGGSPSSEEDPGSMTLEQLAAWAKNRKKGG